MSPPKNLEVNQTSVKSDSKIDESNSDKTDSQVNESNSTKSDSEVNESNSSKSDSKVTRMIILGPSAEISPTELVRKLHMMEFPLTIKSTCYGAAISGEEEVVKKAVKSIRELDPCNIFTKDRGFPPGDPRRCRAKRGGAREGFHQLEKEFELLDDVSKALKNPHKVRVKESKKVSPEEFEEIVKKCD
jgi:putative methanogenesis marker protein 6